jgi:hypothetical protein
MVRVENRPSGAERQLVLAGRADIAPTSQDIRTHPTQLQHYMMAIGAPRGALVYMTPGIVHWVSVTMMAA